jgi:hypothetical protein
MTINNRSDGVTVQFIDENGSPYGIKQINNKPRFSSMPYLYDIVGGNITNHTPFSKLGYTPLILIFGVMLLHNLFIYFQQ